MRASNVWLLVLARDPGGAKTRLASALDASVRSDLVIAMLRDVLASAREVAFAKRVVATESDTVRAIAVEAGFDALTVPDGGMNAAAEAALRAADRAGATAALLLAADLPLVAGDDLERMVEASENAAVVVAPDRHGRGTNALLLAPPLVITPAFGADSLRDHRARAIEAGARFALVDTPGLATDVDDADDLRVVGDVAGEHTASALRAARVR
jgi:2-phospho-L-lactate guanylyltransferase